MSLSAGVQWDVRTTGNDANGGSFDATVGSPGTDYSLQNSPQVVYTDLVIGVTTTQVTSVANPFSAAMVGNTINITGGTGFTTGRYTVVSFTLSGFVATLDRSVGTTASIGGTGNLGGSLLTISAALAATVAGNVVWVKAGTYTITSSLGPQNQANLCMFGYTTTHGDNSTKPLITTSTNSTVLINVQTGSSQQPFIIDNFSLSNTAGTPAVGINKTSNNDCMVQVSNCTLDGFTQGINFDSTISPVSVFNCTIKNCTSDGIKVNNYSAFVVGCYIHDNGGFGINDNNVSLLMIDRCVLANNASGGARSNRIVNAVDSVFYGNGTYGIRLEQTVSSVSSQNCIYYGNVGGTGYGVAQINTNTTYAGVWQTNAFGANTTAATRHLAFRTNASDITLSADPFTNAAAGDFSLNNTAGGGALLRGLGFPGVSPMGTGYADVGPLQVQGASTTITYVVNQVINRIQQEI